VLQNALNGTLAPEVLVTFQVSVSAREPLTWLIFCAMPRSGVEKPLETTHGDMTVPLPDCTGAAPTV
jgi:hypothetical protein